MRRSFHISRHFTTLMRHCERQSRQILRQTHLRPAILSQRGCSSLHSLDKTRHLGGRSRHHIRLLRNRRLQTRHCDRTLHRSLANCDRLETQCCGASRGCDIVWRRRYIVWRLCDIVWRLCIIFREDAAEEASCMEQRADSARMRESFATDSGSLRAGLHYTGPHDAHLLPAPVSRKSP